jgi:predicted Fe-Mo cluster-binding NifX family protein
MKICVPTQTQEGKQAQVYEHFGSAPFFTLVDTRTGGVEVVNNGNQHHAHGMCQPLQAIAGFKVDAVVTGGMGARAVQRLNEGGVKVFRAVPGTVEALVEQYKQGTLEEIVMHDACPHHGCH